MSSTVDFAERDDQPQIVIVAREVRARRRPPTDFDAAFARARIYAHAAAGDPTVVQVPSFSDPGEADRLAARGILD